jgi:serine/threonine protein phosphatase PrpC
MRIEAFSEGKDPGRPEANEDRFVVLPGLAYAVIDGVSDRLGTRYDGMLAGQYGAVLVQRTLQAELAGAAGPPGDARALVGTLTQAIAAAYGRHGTLEAARADANRRFSATLALAIERPDALEILLVGDSGIRLGGARDIRLDKDLDRITATTRRHAWREIARRIDDPARREALSRRVAWAGTAQDPVALQGVLGGEDLAEIEAHAVADAAHAMPHLPRAAIAALVRGGIVDAQGPHQNDGASPLGYSCLDGFPVPAALVHHEIVPRAGLDCVELYTDGYFKPGAGFGIEAWERAFAEAEREDPHKLGPHASVKGTLGAIKADDRTYLGVRWR